MERISRRKEGPNIVNVFPGNITTVLFSFVSYILSLIELFCGLLLKMLIKLELWRKVSKRKLVLPVKMLRYVSDLQEPRWSKYVTGGDLEILVRFVQILFNTRLVLQVLCNWDLVLLVSYVQSRNKNQWKLLC